MRVAAQLSHCEGKARKTKMKKSYKKEKRKKYLREGTQEERGDTGRAGGGY
jgi:hypothetical protein